MGVRADWHEDAEKADPRVDPFGMPSSSTMVMAGDTPALDLTADDLKERLVALFYREKSLFDRMGLECPIKERCDSTCLACPLSEADDGESVKGMLCIVGREQDTLQTLLAVKTSGV